MTITETRPTAAPDTSAATDRAPASGNWLTTGDHKRIGVLFLGAGVAALVGAAILTFLFQLPAFGDGPAVWTAEGSRLSAGATALALLVGIPAIWIGLATYVVPLQIGATRVAHPRVHLLSFWTLLVGTLVFFLGLTARGGTLNSLASSIPSAARPGTSASDAIELQIGGLLLIATALVLSAVALLSTVLTRRAEGLRLAYLPLYSWSVLATSSVLILATPVFMAGLILVFFDQHYGGTVFGSGQGGLRIWEHQLWLPGQPLALLFAAASVGVFADIVVTHARRPIILRPVAQAAVAAGPALTLFLWTGRLSVLRSPFAPTATIGAIAVGLPLGLALVTFLATLKGGRPRFNASLAFVAAFYALIGLATALCLGAIPVGVEGTDADAFRNGQISLLMLGLPLLGLGAAATHWSPKLSGRITPSGLTMGHVFTLLTGPLLLGLSGYLVGLGAGDAVLVLGMAGSLVLALGALLFLGHVAGTGTTAADPYGDALTLEWVAPSPPPPANFVTIPEVRSPYPLAETGANA